MSSKINTESNFDNKTLRQSVLSLMKDISETLYSELKADLEPLLNPSERTVQNYVEQLTFKEGSWYRPLHNLIVPATMLAITNSENGSRDLVLAAQLHDIGYSKIDIQNTIDGADWEKADMRVRHMRIGKEMSMEYLRRLRNDGILAISDARVNELGDIIGNHDNPYIGKPLVGREAKLLRDADRVFVPSTISWYKDLLAYFTDDYYRSEFASLGYELTPFNFLVMRLGNFYPTNEMLPNLSNRNRISIRKELTALTENKYEPLWTQTCKLIIDKLFINRANELEMINDHIHVPEFGKQIESATRSEFNIILELAS